MELTIKQEKIFHKHQIHITIIILTLRHNDLNYKCKYNEKIGLAIPWKYGSEMKIFKNRMIKFIVKYTTDIYEKMKENLNSVGIVTTVDYIKNNVNISLINCKVELTFNIDFDIIKKYFSVYCQTNIFIEIKQELFSTHLFKSGHVIIHSKSFDGIILGYKNVINPIVLITLLPICHKYYNSFFSYLPIEIINHMLDLIILLE